MRETHAGRDRSRLAVPHGAERSPRPAAQDQPGDGESDERDRPAEVVEPVVEHELLTEDLDGDDARGQLRKAEEVDARAAARELLEALDDRRHRDCDRERREREVEPREPKRGDPERKADEAGDETRDRNRPDVLHPSADPEQPLLLVPRHEESGRVAADRHEGAVAERDLAGVAGEHVEPEERDQVDPDVCELLGAKRADPQRQQENHRGEQRERDEAGDPRGSRCHTRFTSGLPKSPDGRTSRTTRITSSAAGSFSSAPTKST